MSRALLRDSTIYGLGTLLTQSLGFVLLPLYTRYLEVSEYGTLSLLNATLQVVSFLSVLGISSAAMRFYFEPDADDVFRRSVYGNATAMLFIFPVGVLLIVGPVIWLLNTRFVAAVPFYPLVLMVIVIGLFSPFIKLITGYMRVTRKARLFVAFNLAFFLTQTLSIIVGVVWLRGGLVGQVAAQLATNVLFAIVAVAALLRLARPSYSPELTRRMLAYGVPLVPFFVFSWINSSAGRFFLERFVDLREVGIFALAAQFAGAMQLAAFAFDNAMLPHFLARAGQPGGARELGTVINRYLGGLGLMGLAIIAGATPLITLMATSVYYGASDYVAPLTLAAWLGVANQPIVWSLNHSKRTSLLSIIAGGSSVLLLLLLAVFLGGLGIGIWGVIAAMICANLLTLICGYAFARRDLAIEVQKGRLAGIVITLLGAGSLLAIRASQQISVGALVSQVALLVVSAVLIGRFSGIGNPLDLLRPRR